MAHNVDKTKFVPVEGWDTHMPYGVIGGMMQDIPLHQDENFLYGIHNCEDVAVFKVSEEAAIISVADYLTAYLEDPYDFGRIVAANAFSYVYALGGHPTHALNMLCFPACLNIEVAGKMMEGGAEKCMEASCSVAGGHSILDDNPKYGLAVSGLVHPDHIFSYSGAKAGDKILVTKKQGTGVINTALALHVAEYPEAKEAVESMVVLDKYAMEAAAALGLHACTNINSYGLAGRLVSMAEGSGLTARIDSRAIPLLALAVDLSEQGITSPGGMVNREFCGDKLHVAETAEENAVILSFDPQTSGGLLLALPAQQADTLLEKLRADGMDARIIGSFENYDGKHHVYYQ